MIVGIGVDVVDVARFEATLVRTPALRGRLFTAAESALATESLAARFAAKEAVAKALPMAWDGPLPWRSIEIINDPRGAPSVSLSGALHDSAAKAGVGEIRVSLSHCDDYAIACAFVAVAGVTG
jgi:holo-[acyl-carrier protein] synthase